MERHLVREVRIIALFIIALLAIGIWLDIIHPTRHEEDTMKYKLKYVRLRPIHEEERRRIQSNLQFETDSMRVKLQKVLSLKQ